MPIIEVQNVSKTFDRLLALDQVSLTIEKGEIVGLLGPNGSGKTTLIRLLSAYFPPSSGHVFIDGYDTWESPFEVRRRVGYALEGVVLYPDLTVRDFLDFVRVVKKASRQQCDEVVAQCGLEGWRFRRIGTLSKGYRQRVMLAQALIGDPPVLILDEPTAGMDPEMAVRARVLMRAIAPSRTVILSTHSLTEALLLCHRVLVLHQGRMLAHGRTAEIFPGQPVPSTLEDEFIRLTRMSATV